MISPASQRHLTLGQFELHALSDGTFALDGGQMFGIVPKPLWERKAPADERNRVRLSLTCLLIRKGRQNILVETGIGDKFDAKFKDIYDVRHPPTLLASLAEVGLRPEDIHIVINTHLHFDHCGWNTRRVDGKTVPTFPRARYLIQRGEWERAINPTERERASYSGVFPAGRVADGVSGWRRGNSSRACAWKWCRGTHAICSACASNPGMSAPIFISDTVPTAAHLPYPWIMSFDLYPMETLASKKRLLPELAERRAIVIFPHDPNVPWLRLRGNEGKIATEAV